MSIRRLVLVLWLVPSIALAQGADKAAPDKPVAGEDDQLYSCKSRDAVVQVSFKPDTELKDLITWAMGFTCKNFVFNPSIIGAQKKVTIIAPNKMSAAEAYRVFLVALSTLSYTVVPKGNVLKIIEASTAKSSTVPIQKHGVPSGEQIVRYVLRPAYATAESLAPALQALKSPDGDVQVISSMLLVTDYGSHIADMLSLVKLIDVPKGSDGIYTLPVLHADAAKLAEKITSILGMQSTAATPAAPKPGDKPAAGTPAITAALPSRLLVDERTNTLIVASTEAGYNRVKALVDRLDIALDIEGGAQFHVYRLSSAIAEELAKTLNESINGAQAASPKQPPGAPIPQPMAPLDNLGATLQGQVRVIADKPTNSLLVMSSGRDFLAIKQVIQELDIPRRQVYIETVILEVTTGDKLDLGSSSHSFLPWLDNAVLVGGVQMPNLKSVSLESLIGAEGLLAGLVGKELANLPGLSGKSIPSYGLLFQAIGKSSNTNLVSTVAMMGVDNEESKKKVGINIPYKKGSTPVLNGTSQVENFDRRDVGIELTIKPHISGDDMVLLEVKHEASDLFSKDADGPVWSTRSLDTRVVVRDQQTVVIGGLTQDKTIDDTTKVPLLGDIPILGYLFKYKHREKTKTNLLILLTPYIVKDQMDIETIHQRKVREYQEFTGSFRRLDNAAYHPKIDYTRKRGVVEEINRAQLAIEQDIAAQAALRSPPKVQSGAIEYGTPEPETTAKP
ncbi:MAG TPA: type II secretion system secretin GspD [Kofleriaceae bacterium]|nr:type II secretion system secretin GspD [Kofleriaceae bacterium]